MPPGYMPFFAPRRHWFLLPKDSPALPTLCYSRRAGSLPAAGAIRRRRTDSMKRTLLIVADLGNFRAFEWDGNEFHSTPRLELVDDFETVEARGIGRNTLTVIEHRSAKSPGNEKTATTGSDGEQHNMQLEKRRRLIRQMAERVTDLLRLKDVERCFFAAPGEI